MLMRSTSILLAMSFVGCGLLNKKSDDDQPAASVEPPKQESPNRQQPQTHSGDTTGSTTKVQVSAVDQFKSSIQGLWKTTCSNGSIKAFNFDGANVSLSSKSFKDGTCTAEKMTLRYTGLYSIKDPATVHVGGYNASYKFDTIYLTVNNADTVLALNLTQSCGYSDWGVGVEKKISSSMPNCDLAKDGETGVLSEHFLAVFVQEGKSLSTFATDNSVSATYVMQKQ